MKTEPEYKDRPCELTSQNCLLSGSDDVPDIQHLSSSIDMLSAELDADLCSIFTYNAITKRLVCTISKDIKGLSIPIDKGIAGIVFLLGQVINVQEIKSDARHNGDIDNQTKYTTQSLLCAPIIGVDGKPVGVIQALNKKGSSHFTKHDEILMCRYNSQLCSSFRGTDHLSAEISKPLKEDIMTEISACPSRLNRNAVEDCLPGISTRHTSIYSPTGNSECSNLCSEESDDTPNSSGNYSNLTLKRPHCDEPADGDGGALKLIESAINQLKLSFKEFGLSSEMQLNLNNIISSLDNLICTESDLISSIGNDVNAPKRSKSPIVGLCDPEIKLIQDVFSWDFNVLEIDDKLVLINVFGQIFGALHFHDGLDIDVTILANYIREIATKYSDNPFHNLQHSACVTHMVYMLICATGANKYLSTIQLFGCVVSALVHDVDHPGNTNMFEVSTFSHLAVLYNDKSVLENHHCSTAFQTMRKDSTNILKGLSKLIASELRKIILTCVLATDMTEHFGLVDKTKRIIAGGDYSFNETEDKMFLCTLLVHSADLSNPTRPFHLTEVTSTEIIHIIHPSTFTNLYERTFLFVHTYRSYFSISNYSNF
jgi:hypothetical protein